MLGYCGINCDTCPAYRGTITTDRELLEKAMADYGKEGQTIEDWVCLGCTPGDQGFLATYCAECAIRACAVERGVQNCAACEDYDGCEKMRAFLETEPESLATRMAWLRSRFTGSDGTG